ncbi:putative vacuolar protein sorting-associated protein [Lupinus albus]|uniref:Putative vacuolar protein sorting-associated protein n=1 Tax=Lupinus albus TaxID=3870 RepID=A0A6A4P506_LUPAL|nr:putative vacuolar protein sorting-associated protein [Lupinus albus]
MLEDQVAYLLQRYLGNYVRGLNKEALKISVWKGDVELKNMQLKPEALNALKLPVKVKAGFLGSVKLKVPWSRLGQDPVLVSLDRIFLLAEPATQVEGCTEDAVQEAKKSLIQEMELKLWEKSQQFKSEMNKSWLGSLISTIIGNLKLSISNIHIRYEDCESNPGHPFSAGVMLDSLSAVTVDDTGKETFITGGALSRIQKSVELDGLAVYLDSDIIPWHVNKAWEDLLPSEWFQVFKFGTIDGKPVDYSLRNHSYILQPVTGKAKYYKLRLNEVADSNQPLHRAVVNLDDVTISLSKDGYRDITKLAENFAAFNQRLKYAHYRPLVPVKANPKSWWRYAYRAVSDQMKKASGKMSWEQVLRYTSLRKRYISLYAILLKSDPSQVTVSGNKEIEELDRELDIGLILQWRMLAHKFLEQSAESDLNLRKQKVGKSWWSFGWTSNSPKEESEEFNFSEEDLNQLNKIIGYKEGDEGQSAISSKADVLHTSLVVHMNHNASKLTGEANEPVVELSCEDLSCSIKLYPETKVFDIKLGSYQLSSPKGLLAESATSNDSLVGVFCYKPFDDKVDWSMVAKASPCYMTYIKESIDQIVKFFESNTAVSQTIAVETAAAVQMKFDEVKRTAQQQMNRALKDHARFSLDLDIAAPKITIPTDFCPDNTHATKLLLDLGNLLIRTQDDCQQGSTEENMYLRFDLVLSDVSAFLFDGDYHWSQFSKNKSARSTNSGFLPIIDECVVILQLQQIRLERPYYPSTRLAVRLPSLGFHFSPARYHRLMQVIKIFEGKDGDSSEFLRPWHQADLEGWLSLLTWKGLGIREAVWQRRYFCLVGTFLYVLESPDSRSYKQCTSLRGKQVYQVPPELVADAEHVLVVCSHARSSINVVEDSNALIFRCESADSLKTWHSRLQGAMYYALDLASISGLSETSSDHDDTELEHDNHDVLDVAIAERLFVTGVLDELKVCFSYSYQSDQSLMKVLLNEERHLLEFRAIGGQVELSIRDNDIFIGTILKSLEIEDLVCRTQRSQPFYLARSFVGTAVAHSLLYNTTREVVDSSGLIPSETDDMFYEAPETLTDSGDYPMQSPGGTSEYSSSSNSEIKYKYLSLSLPKFSRITGLLPSDAPSTSTKETELTDTLESFVKAQIVIYDLSSTRYNNTDKQVIVTLATLTFFCRRPTILAIMEFINCINIEDGSVATSSDSSSTAIMKNDESRDVNDLNATIVEEHAVKGLLGKGKSRIMFNLTLNMAQTQILLMKENETKLACLSQESLLTDINVFPSSFSIKAALGNLKISDDSLPSSHLYYWACDMRNPGGKSFVELEFTSFSNVDEDYNGYDFSLFGKLSEVRIVYLNRFVQEVVGYFMGLIPTSPKSVIKVTDQVTNSEKWFSASEIEGSPAVKFDLSLRKPIILMPRRTDSLDFLRLDIVHITLKNTFQWIGGSKSEINAVHLETLTVQVEDINLNVGTGTDLGESIIQDVNGLSVIIHRSLRDLLHQFPSTEVIIKIDQLKAAVSNKEYQIIAECAVSNFSEVPNIPPPLSQPSSMTSNDGTGDNVPEVTNDVDSTTTDVEASILLKISVSIYLVELSLYTGVTRDASLATIQVSGAWLLYKSITAGKGFLSATLQGFSVFDDREGVGQEFRLAIGKPQNDGASPLNAFSYYQNQELGDNRITKGNNFEPVTTMLIVDMKFGPDSTFVSLCVQRPQLLVALDFLLAVVEFFVPTVSSMISYEENNKFRILEAIIMDQSIYRQPSAEFSLSPQKPLIVDDESFDHFIYDGDGGTLYLKDRQGFNLTAASSEAIIYVGSGKKLQFRNVVIKGGQHLDSCVFLGANSCYSTLKDDHVYLEGLDEISQPRSPRGNVDEEPYQSSAVDNSTELIIEIQAVGPELTFYNTSKDIGESLSLSNKLLLAQLDAFCRLVLKGNNTEMSADVLGLTMESNGIRILEPFDTFVKYSNASGKTNINLSVSDIFMNFTFSILRLFLAVEDDILAFLRTTSKKMTIVCSHFDKVGTIKNSHTGQTYAFWRPHAPPGFAVLGDYLTPLDKPPTKGVLVINTNAITVKKPISFNLIWPPLTSLGSKGEEMDNADLLCKNEDDSCCSIWFPEAPKGYITLGCVATRGRTPPPLSSAFCIPSSSVSPCSLRDCITIGTTDVCSSSVAFWRVDNSIGTFLPVDPTKLSLMGKAYELRCIKYDFLKVSSAALSSLDSRSPSGGNQTSQSSQSGDGNSNRRFEAVASFQLIWWNQGSTSRKKLSIWRPVVPMGMVYFGDIAVNGYEPPNTCIVVHDSRDENIFKTPLDFQLVGQIKKQRGIEGLSFWLPQVPPGFVSLGCVACKGKPKQGEFGSLRCVRSDLVAGDKFLEESVWDTSDTKYATEPFSIWSVGNELGTFIVRGGLKKPPRRFAVKLADSSLPSGSDITVIDAVIGTFSTALFDDYGGLMVPLFNVSSSGITFSLHGRTEYLNCTASFSFAARSYNDKYEAWEPLVEPVDGFLRYQYDLNALGTASQLRLTSTRDLNLNISVSNVNMIIQAYASWNNLTHAHECYKNRDAFSPTSGGNSIIDTLQRRNYYIIPQNKLGQDIFIRATEARDLQNITRMPSGDMKAVKVPVSKNMLDSHFKGKLCKKIRTMVTVIIAEAQFPRVEGSDSQQYTVAVRLSPNQSLPTDALVHQQSARTCGRRAHPLLPSDLELVKWNEIFFFRVDSLDYYSFELIVTDMSKGVPIGLFSTSLNQIVRTIKDSSSPQNFASQLNWIDLSAESSTDAYYKSPRKLRTAVLVHSSEVENNSQPSNHDEHKSGFIQISPSKEGPWTTVRLNYAAPAACWRLGNDVVASEVRVKDGNRYVNIRSLVSVRNNTDFVLDLCLTSKNSYEKMNLLKNSNSSVSIQTESNRVQIDEFYETEKLTPHRGWVGCSGSPGQHFSETGNSHQAFPEIDLPPGWQWIDDWNLDINSTSTSDGWIYAPDVESLRWPESFDSKESPNSARQRRWLRSRKLVADDLNNEISVGLLQPGETAPLPLSGLSQTVQYFLQLRPWTSANPSEYSWSSVVDRPSYPEDAGMGKQCSKLCVSALSESEELLCCSEIHGTSAGFHKLWFCVSIQATEIAKDIHSDAIQDWCLVIKSPLLISNYLPLAAEYSVLEMQSSGHFLACSRGVFLSGKTVQIYSADIRNPLFLSLLPQRGWLPIHEAVLISHPQGVPSKTIGLRSSISGRVIQIILEQNYDKERPLLAKTIRVYAPCWLGAVRCPPLTFRILDMSGKRRIPKIASQSLSDKKNGLVLEEITEEEIYDGYTIASALNFNMLALSVAIAQSGSEHFGPVQDLSPLGDMDGSLDIYAYDGDGNCLRLFISTKPCPYQSIPTKVISVRPFMTFTNRLGQDIFIKLSTEDSPKVLHASDSRVSFVCRGIGGPEKLQVKLDDTNWSFPLQISREDTISVVLRTHDGTLKFLRTEIRGYEEGSRFVVVFRLGSTDGPMRIENRTANKALHIRQSGFGEDSWIQLQPLSTTNFSWEDPYGDKFLDAKLGADDITAIWKLDLGRSELSSAEFGLKCHVIHGGDIIVVKFSNNRMLDSSSYEELRDPMPSRSRGVSGVQAEMKNSATPFELLIELGVVGISIVDHRPKELSYLYMERVFLSYSTGYDGGRTSRLKFIFGYLQLDNQLPLTLMPVLLAPDQTSDVQHPVFKMTVTMQNENKDGIQVYPYVYIRVTEKCWRLDIHEPIIWAIVDFCNSLQLDRLPKSSTVTVVDPEIRFDLIDVSEVRLKLSLETAPGQRPHGVLGIWSPILSAVGNAFKIQVHLRRVMHRDRFMRKSSVGPAIGNRVWRDLIHNPLHLIFSVDVLGMTSSTLASLSRGFAELSTDGQFLQLRAKQVRSRRITGVGDGIMQGTEALAQGVAFGVSGIVRKPVQSAQQNGLLGLANGIGRAFLGFIVQPVSGALDFFSMTVDGIGASCSKCLKVFNNKTTFHRIRNPRAIHANGILREYCEREAIGQMVLYLGEARQQFGCAEIFKEPSKFALSDYYEEHFTVAHQRIVLVTNKRVMLLQCIAPDKMDRKPCKIMWDMPWDELMALELAKAGSNQPSHLILHLKHFRRAEFFVRVIKCNIVEEFEGREPQAIKICSVVRKTWKAYQSDMKSLVLKVPSSQRQVHFAWSEVDSRQPRTSNKAIISSREISSCSTVSDDRRFIKHSITFSKIWSSEQEYKGRCSLYRKQTSQDAGICSIWRPVCPDGYTCIGDIARVGIHAPNVAAVYRKIDGLFALPIGYDLVWRNCSEDYITPVSIWHPRAPDGFVSPGCVAIAGYMEPELDLVHCVAESLVEETEFEEQKVWSAPDSYPWACHIYPLQSDALHFVALRQTKEDSDWKPKRIRDVPPNQLQSP